MRHSRHTQGEEEAEINLTPMLDVIFILLIFFIVTTSFAKQAGVEVQPPGAKTAQKQEHNNLLVAVTKKGEVWVDGKQIDIRALRSQVQRQRAENPNMAVVVQADKNARTGLVVKVMDQVRLAGVKRVALAAQPE